MSELLQAVEPITGLIASLAAEQVANIRQEGGRIADVEEVLGPYRDRVEDSGNLLNQRRYFYETLVTIGGNSQLASVLPMMRIHLLRLQIQSFLDNTDRYRHLAEYSAIAKAVMAGNPSKASRLMCSHIARMRLLVLEMPDLAFSQH